jgi:hypothetical protein
MNLRAIKARVTTLAGWPEMRQDGNSWVALDVANSKTDAVSVHHRSATHFSPLSFTGAGEIFESGPKMGTNCEKNPFPSPWKFCRAQ